MAERFVEYSMRLKPDAGGARALDDLSRKSQKLERDADRAGKALQNAQRGKSGPGGIPLPGGGALQFDMPGPEGRGGLGTMMAGLRVFAAAKATEYVLQNVTKGINTANDPMLTAFDKQKAYKQMVPFAETWIGFIEAVGGFTARMKALTIETQRAAAEIQAVGVGQTRQRGVLNQLYDLRAAAAGSRAAAELATSPEGRAALADPRRAGAFEGRISAEGAFATAQNRRAYSAIELDQARRAADYWGADVRQQQAAMPRLEDVKTYQQREQYQDRLNLLVQANLRERQAINRLIAAEADYQTRSLEVSRAKFEVAKATAAVDRDRLAALREEESALKSSAAAFAQLRPEERTLAADLAERVKKRGIDALSDAERDLLKRGGLEKAVSDIAAAGAESSEDFRRALRGLEQRTIDDVRIDIERLRPNVELNVHLDADEFAKAVVRESDPRLRSAVATLKRDTENELRQQELSARTAAISGTK